MNIDELGEVALLGPVLIVLSLVATPFIMIAAVSVDMYWTFKQRGNK